MCRYQHHCHDEIVSEKKTQRKCSHNASLISVVLSQSFLVHKVIILSLFFTAVTFNEQRRLTNAIKHSLDVLQVNGRNRIAFFKWNSDGWLTNTILPITKGTHWVDSYYTGPTLSSDFDRSNGFNKTSKSPLGKGAMMYGWDTLKFVLQKPKRVPLMDPPIPMFLFSIPQQQQITIEDDEKNISSSKKLHPHGQLSPFSPNHLILILLVIIL
jgi:hypothetical protein